MDGYLGSIVYGDGYEPHTARDWHHDLPEELKQAPPDPNRGRGLVIQVNQNEFYLVGANYRIFLRPKLAPSRMFDASFVSDFLQSKLAHQVKVDEGHFDQNGEYIVDRRRNGDVITGGVWVEPDTGVVRVIMCD
jgi:hypothetical protein